MRDLQQHAGAVAGARIASACASMGQVVEDLDALAHDVMRAHALDVDDEADAACVVLVAGRVEALCWRYAAVFMHGHTLFGSATIVFTTPWRCLRAWPLPATSLSSVVRTEIFARSVWVDSTTIVSV